jgi:hypothetical protein
MSRGSPLRAPSQRNDIAWRLRRRRVDERAADQVVAAPRNEPAVVLLDDRGAGIVQLGD